MTCMHVFVVFVWWKICTDHVSIQTL